MPNYTVTWKIDIDASSSANAAILARLIQFDPNSLATQFMVSDGAASLSMEDVQGLSICTPEEDTPCLSVAADLIERVQYLLRDIIKEVPEMVSNLRQAGALDEHADYLDQGRDFAVPKKVLEAILQSREGQYWPPTHYSKSRKSELADIKNYRFFI